MTGAAREGDGDEPRVRHLVNTAKFDKQVEKFDIQEDKLVIPRTGKHVIVRRTVIEEIEYPEGTA